MALDRVRFGYGIVSRYAMDILLESNFPCIGCLRFVHHQPHFVCCQSFVLASVFTLADSSLRPQTQLVPLHSPGTLSGSKAQSLSSILSTRSPSTLSSLHLSSAGIFYQHPTDPSLCAASRHRSDNSSARRSAPTALPPRNSRQAPTGLCVVVIAV